jgi:hypothetical protein
MFYGRLKFCRKTARMYAKPCEQPLIANNLKKAGWSLGWVSAVDCYGRTQSGSLTRIVATETSRHPSVSRVCRLCSRFFELARVLVRLDHIACVIVNANHSIM